MKTMQVSVVLVLLLLLLGLARLGVDGICSVQHCTDPSTCVLSRDQRRCKCVEGFYSDRCDKNADVRVTCGRDSISVRALEDFFSYHKVALESLHLANRSCGARREVVDGAAYYVISVSRERYLSCGGKPLQKNVTHVSYSVTLTSEPQVFGNIIRDPVVKMAATCVYPYVRTVSMKFPVHPFSSETVMRVDELDATVQMMLFTDHTYQTPFGSAPTIELRDKVYVEVTVMEPVDYFLLRVDECWASQSPRPNDTDGATHTLLQNGCVSDPTVSFLDVNVSAGADVTSGSRLGRNGAGFSVRYSFDMFRFTTEPHSLYLHCSVRLCEVDDLESCTPSCSSISKREAVMSSDPAHGLLSYGPIRIKTPRRPQTSVLVAAAMPVVAVWTVGFFLIVVTTVAKAGGRRLQEEEQRP